MKTINIKLPEVGVHTALVSPFNAAAGAICAAGNPVMGDK